MNDLDAILELYSKRMKWFKENNIKQWTKCLENHPRTKFHEIMNFLEPSPKVHQKK